MRSAAASRRGEDENGGGISPTCGRRSRASVRNGSGRGVGDDAGKPGKAIGGEAGAVPSKPLKNSKKEGKGGERKRVKLEEEKEGGRERGGDERDGEDGDAEAEAKEESSRKRKRKRRRGEKKKAREAKRGKEKEKKEVDCSKGVFIDSFQQNKYTYGPIREGDGVMFVTYSSLVAANRDGKSRLKQVSECVLVFIYVFHMPTRF